MGFGAYLGSGVMAERAVRSLVVVVCQDEGMKQMVCKLMQAWAATPVACIGGSWSCCLWSVKYKCRHLSK